MRIRRLAVLCTAALLATAAPAGLFKNSVDLADLSEVSPEALQTLVDTEFAVFTAQVRLNGVKAAERRAAGGAKAASQTLDAENLDLKAAKAELKAAKANQDDERTTAATAMIAGAEEDQETAKALRRWKNQEQEARQAEVAMAKSAVDLAEAERDLARVRLLNKEQLPSAKKYELSDFESNVVKRRKELDVAGDKAKDKLAKLDKLKSEWDQLAKNLDLGEVEEER